MCEVFLALLLVLSRLRNSCNCALTVLAGKISCMKRAPRFGKWHLVWHFLFASTLASACLAAAAAGKFYPRKRGAE